MEKPPQSQPSSRVQLDLNNPEFLKNLLEFEKSERNRLLDTFKKLLKLYWDQVYKDPGLKWEKITSVKPPKGMDAIYSIRITQGRRATAVCDGVFMRFLTVESDHDATYGKK
jgi:hypothetical protein